MTYQISQFNAVRARRTSPSRLRYCALPLSLAFAGCSDGPVSLGNNDVTLEQEPSPCAGGTVTHDVKAQDQAAIDALLGCEVIDGNLTISLSPVVQARTSLAALASLRRVRGTLTIHGAASLEGLERLEQVGNLDLEELATEDLSSLQSLARVFMDPPGYEQGGGISISACNNLRNLSGLEHLTTWSSLVLRSLPSLESVLDLTGPPRLTGLFIDSTPALLALNGLEFAHSVDQVSISQTGLRRLNGFALSQTQLLRLDHNPALQNLDALTQLQSVDTLHISDNASLVRVDLPNLREVHAITITGNDALLSVPSYNTENSGISFGSDMLGVIFSQHTYEVANNAQLTSIASPFSYSEVQQVAISGNPKLVVLDLSPLNRADGLVIRGNPRLSSISLTSLERVGDLEVVDNPQLSTDSFRAVQTFSSSMSGNLGAPAP